MNRNQKRALHKQIIDYDAIMATRDRTHEMGLKYGIYHPVFKFYKAWSEYLTLFLVLRSCSSFPCPSQFFRNSVVTQIRIAKKELKRQVHLIGLHYDIGCF